MDRRPQGWRAVLAPELAAALVAVVVWGVIGLGLLTGGSGAAATASPSAGAASPTSEAPSATLEGSLLVLIRSSNARLLEHRQALVTLLDAETLDTAEVAATVRQVNAAATFAAGIADRIASQPGGASIAAALSAAYDPILATAEEVLSLALANEAGHRKGAERLVELIDAIPDVDALVAAAATPTATTGAASPPSSAKPTATTAPTKTPKPASPSPTKTPKPASPSPTATAGPGESAEPTSSAGGSPIPTLATNLLANPGFESGSQPWQFVLAGSATGSFTVTTDDPASGAADGLITLSSGAGPWSAASLSQGGLQLDNGTNYHVRVWARSTGPRDIRVRVTTGLGEVIASRILSIGAEWTEVAFDLTAIGTLTDASLVVETGISSQPVWLDDLGIGP